jgi:hypothetical protein
MPSQLIPASRRPGRSRTSAYFIVRDHGGQKLAYGLQCLRCESFIFAAVSACRPGLGAPLPLLLYKIEARLTWNLYAHCYTL